MRIETKKTNTASFSEFALALENIQMKKVNIIFETNKTIMASFFLNCCGTG